MSNLEEINNHIPLTDPDVAVFLSSIGYKGPHSPYCVVEDEATGDLILASIDDLPGCKFICSCPYVEDAVNYLEQKRFTYIWAVPDKYNGLNQAVAWVAYLHHVTHWRPDKTHRCKTKKDAIMAAMRRLMIRLK